MLSKVTIIIPTYKRSRYIKRAVESALNQNHDNFEVIVVDDNNPGSDERALTEQSIQQFLKYPNFKYIKHEKNKNGSAARNTGIKNSTGTYITFLDDDDEYYENKILEQSKVLDELDSSWGLVYSSFDKIDRFGNNQTNEEKAEGDVFIQVLTKNLFIGSGSNFMVRKKIVDEINGFDETFKRNQDLEFLVRVAKKYKFKSIEESLFLIHNEDQDKSFTYEELKKIHSDYRMKFNSLINELTHQKQEEVKKTLDLWDLRLAFSKGKFLEAIRIYARSSLKLKDIYKYLRYLINRGKSKKSYGFKL